MSRRGRCSRWRGDRFPRGYREALARYRYGPARSNWIGRWMARSRGGRRSARRAATVHLGGTLEEIARVGRGATPAGRSSCWRSRACSMRSRAPAGKHTAWAYCHVPNGATVDMTEAIEAQVERFAPGFRARILARSVRDARRDLERDNANLVGRRYQRRRDDSVAAFLAADAEPVPDTASGRVLL